MIELTEYLPAGTVEAGEVYAQLELPFELRQKSRQRVTLSNGENAALLLERGTVLRGGDFVASAQGSVVKVVASLENLSCITCETPRDLARVAYHIGNRHVGMELRLGKILIARDSVLTEMLQALGAKVEEICAPFEPEGGAYGHGGHHHAIDEHAHGGRIHEYATSAGTDEAKLAALVRLLDLASASLPVGAFCYSQGMETAITLGWVSDRENAKQWLRHLLVEGTGKLEAPVWLRIYRAWQANDPAQAARWNDFFLASRESSELRSETVQMGYSLRRLLENLGDERVETPPDFEEPTFVALFSYAVAAFGINAEEGLAAYLWTWLENQVMALVKAVPLGQTDGRILLLALGKMIPEITLHAATIEDDELAASAPMATLASMMHETQYTRLFRS